MPSPPCSKLASALGIGLALGTSVHAWAQVPLEGPERAPAKVASAPALPPPSPPPEPPIERPKPLQTATPQPGGFQGSHTVVLELLVTVEGSVAEVRLVSGEPPFSLAALEAAPGWRFEPARRSGQPVPARVRFAVVFEAPSEKAANEPTDEPAPRPPRALGQRPPPDATPAPIASDDGEERAVDVTVSGERPEAGSSLNQAEVRELPGAFGDAFRAIEVLPGVVPIVSGLPYFYVRGAPPGNVGYFFDGVRVPVLYHFAAGPAILHPAFVGRVDLYPGAYPARYGRYAGAVVTGEMQDPEYRVRGEASIRLIDSGGMLEAPFGQGQGSVMAGGRFSYTGLLLSLLSPDVTVTYWDYQSRTRYALDHDDSVELLWFGSGDFVSQVEQNFETGQRETMTVVDLGFHRLDARWDRQLPDGKWRNALMLGVDKTWLGNGEVELTSLLLGLRSEVVRDLSPKHHLRAGADVLFESLGQVFEEPEDDVSFSAPMADEAAAMMAPGAPPTPSATTTPPPQMVPSAEEVMAEDEQRSPEPGDADFDLGFGERIDFVGGAYADVVMQLAPRVEFTPGLRFDVFVSRNDIALGVDPRLRVRYQVHEELALIHALGLAHQMPSFPIPVPGITPSLKGGLQRAVQHSASAEFDIGGGFDATTTLFHSVFFNMTDLIGVPGAASTGFRSTGHAYGFEAMLKRTLTRRLGGFASYTLSRSERSLARFHGPSTTDRTHVFNAALSYDLGRNWRFGNRFLFYTGLPSTLGEDEPDITRRAPPFWRLDWRLQKRWLYPHGRHVGLIFEVLNTTLNEEVISVECDEFGCYEEKIGPVTIPSIGVEGSF